MHSIQAIVVRENLSGILSNTLKSAILCPFPQELTLIPLTSALKSEMAELIKEPLVHIDPSIFEFANPELFSLLMTVSSKDQIGYFETNYFGGNGYQSSILFRHEEIIGPFRVESSDPERTGAINKLLSLFGIKKENASDEFETLGLHHFRSNHALIKKHVK